VARNLAHGAQHRGIANAAPFDLFADHLFALGGEGLVAGQQQKPNRQESEYELHTGMVG